MKKIDLTQVKFLDVMGREAMIDIARVIGNIMYMQGQDIVESELGHKVFHSADPLGDYNPNIGWKPKADETRPDCSIELSDKEKDILLGYVKKNYSYVIFAAVKKALE